ncbi:ABC transporter permease [Chachezhania antarctica]|uniref:ABC transporter permease n=1 Tax=Chachezhania antarctica TaxID=2340860 RepID=UPI000EB2B1D6|nr:ABC transporter permease [Chachezhania antarctica]|tara:strand:- start:784 stop:1695 length:912 start_codon:yes stop_codon:yes gene_type:complete
MADLTSQGTAGKTPDTTDAHEAALLAYARKKKLSPFLYLPVAWLVFVILLAVFAPWLGLWPADEIDWVALRVPPGANEAHPLGTDHLGRDMLSRLIYGARVSLTVGFAAPAIGVGFGMVLGMAAGYWRGWIDEVVGIAIDSWLAIPGLVILLLFALVFGGSLFMVCFSLGLLFIPTAARITRAATMKFANREFVLAARALGASDLRILVREILPNVIWPLIAFILIDIPIAIVIEGALSFLGLSVKAPTPSWGGIIAEGREYLETAPWISLIPTAVMFTTVLSFNLVGDAIRRRMADVRESQV